MKKYILLLIGLLVLGISYSQENKNSGETKTLKDEFTYKKINVLDNEEGHLSMTGGNNSSSSKSLSASSSKAFSSGSSSSGIGETQGKLSVSLTGSAVYDIPITVPAGINGVTPEVSLTYNSQSGNGIAGYGWNISGISTISRIPSTKYHDNEIDGVDFDALDRFALDGQRLVIKNGTYGANGAEYETEMYSNLKITSYGTSSYGANFGPAYFIVNYPDGSIAHYGNGGSSHSRTNYSITYWQNPQGVRVSYEYFSYNNTQSISKIKYGGLNGIGEINEIRFDYRVSSERREQAYVTNSFVRSRILENIYIYSNNVQYRKYVLDNFNDTTPLKYERLKSITEYSGDNTLAHSSIDFNYTTSTSGVNYNEITTNLGLANIEQRNAAVVSLDLTANGKMDFLVYPTAKNKFWVFKDLQSTGTNYPYEVTTGDFEAVFPTTWLNYQNKVIPGQGITVVQNGVDNQVNFKVYSNGTTNPIYYQYTKTWNALSYEYDYSNTSSIIKSRPNEYVSGDFNGDGLTDVLAIGKPYTKRTCYEYDYTGNPDYYDELDDYNNYMYLYYDSYRDYYIDVNGLDSYYCTDYTHNNNTAFFIDLKQDITTGFVNYAGYLQKSLSADDRLHTADFNGDGKTDILHVTDGKLYVYTLNNSNVLTLLWETSDTSINSIGHLLLGDYNGDGKTDLLNPTANNSYSFKIFISTGSAFEVATKTQPFKHQNTNWNGNNGVNSGFNLVPIDVNGDGKTDIVEYNTTTYNSGTNGTQVINVYNNLGLNGTTVSTSIDFVSGGSASKTGNLKHYPIPIFLTSNQPNKNLDFASISDSWVTSFSFTQDHREDMLLRSISNNGVTQTIDYSNLDPTLYNSDNMQIYEDSYGETYPYVDLHIAPSTKVVTELQRISSGTTTIKQLYTYYGAVYNAQGLGFLGFKGVARSNWHTSSSDRIFSVSKFDPLLRGALTDSYKLTGSFSFTVPSSGYISKTTNAYPSPTIASNKVFKLSATSSLTQNALEGTNTNVTYLYNTYNNPTKITTSFLGTGSRVVDINYANSTGSTYYIGRPTSQVETNTIGGESFSTTKEFVYSGYLLTQLKVKGDSTPFDIEAYNYDAFGNIIKKTITPNGETAREVEFEYDNSGRFLTKSIDVEDLETTYQHNVNTGTLSKETNPFGQEINFTYDSWNRPTKVTDYLGNDVTTSYVESNYSYTVTNTGDDGSGAITIYDPLKRVTTAKGKDVLGQWVNTSYLYDKFDRPFKVSEPYTGSGASQWNETEYDLYGRPTKLTEYTGKVTTITYSGLATTVNDGTKTVTTTKDDMGNVASVTDPGGTITYAYYGNGSLKNANYNGVIVSTEQDGWGRKTKLTDSSAGIFTYAYNGYGEIITETTPKGSTAYTYSSIGKLSQKQITGDNTSMTTQYGYNTTNKLLSSISLVSTDGNNANYVYTYDGEERLISSSENNVHAQFTTQYTYDAFGRIGTEEYYGKLLSNSKTSTKKIKNTYQNGGLKTAQDFSTNEVLWNVIGLNARGQVTTSTMGNDLQKQNTYDSYGYLTESKSEKNVSTSAVELMKLTTNFNTQKGTLTSRTNSMFSWSENFTYDSMDRLVNFNDNNDNKNHTYDLLGRITTNSEVGDYTYTGNSYQLDDVDLNNQGDFYFQNKALQQVTYNAFKKPFEINQDGKEKIGFQYNAFNGRSHMFYGNTNSDILLRNNRKHYSSDGSMEISHDTATGTTTFVTYIGDDAYNAPAIWRSEQGGTTSEEYLYLHRDYLGSILMISDKNGSVKEKRHFDAWGNIVKLTDGNGNNLDKFVYLDRGYTGHEHLQGVNLIHMNGRLYDPKLKRFLAPDNNIQDIGNTQNFNRYSYVLNNPLMYVDPSGETYNPPGDEQPGYDYERSLKGAQSVPIEIDFRGFRNWVGNNTQSALSDIGGFFEGIGNWIGGLFRRPKSAPIEYSNYEGLTSDPIVGPSTNISTSFFGGGGTDTGGLGVVGRYYSSLWNGFTNQIKATGSGISNLLSHPIDTIGAAASNHWNTITNPISFINSLDETYSQYNAGHQILRNAITSYYSDDFVGTFGRLNGENLADKTVEAAGLAAGGIGGRVLSRGLTSVRLGLSGLNRATGGAKQWLRIGRSHSVTGDFSTYGLRWGSSPRFVRKIKNLKLRNFNRKIRGMRINRNGWRFQDGGHWHWWKLRQ